MNGMGPRLKGPFYQSLNSIKSSPILSGRAEVNVLRENRGHEMYNVHANELSFGYLLSPYTVSPCMICYQSAVRLNVPWN
jgi:hypothetical protein